MPAVWCLFVYSPLFPPASSTLISFLLSLPAESLRISDCPLWMAMQVPLAYPSYSFFPSDHWVFFLSCIWRSLSPLRNDRFLLARGALSAQCIIPALLCRQSSGFIGGWLDCICLTHWNGPLFTTVSLCSYAGLCCWVIWPCLSTSELTNPAGGAWFWGGTRVIECGHLEGAVGCLMFSHTLASPQ